MPPVKAISYPQICRTPFAISGVRPIEQVMDSQQFILGSEVQSLEQEIASYSRTKHAIGCASGSDALLLALMSLDVKSGDEVITPSFTFFATAGSIARLGARPAS